MPELHFPQHRERKVEVGQYPRGPRTSSDDQTCSFVPSSLGGHLDRVAVRLPRKARLAESEVRTGARCLLDVRLDAGFHAQITGVRFEEDLVILRESKHREAAAGFRRRQVAN